MRGRACPLALWIGTCQPELPTASRTDAAFRSGEYFLQFEGQPQDLLWFGDVVGHLGLSHGPRNNPGRPYMTISPGVLTPSRDVGGWLMRRANRGAPVFEPESLYRGILYGTALTILGLTSGARLAELLGANRSSTPMTWRD